MLFRSEIFAVIQRANKYIDENAPWALAKDMEANGGRLAHVLYNLLEATRICAILLIPFMPESMDKLFVQIGAGEDIRTWDSAAVWGSLSDGAAVTKGENLFPRVDAEKALEELERLEAEAKKATLPEMCIRDRRCPGRCPGTAPGRWGPALPPYTGWRPRPYPGSRPYRSCPWSPRMGGAMRHSPWRGAP